MRIMRIEGPSLLADGVDPVPELSSLASSCWTRDSSFWTRSRSPSTVSSLIGAIGRPERVSSLAEA